jgi:hypothetical protein
MCVMHETSTSPIVMREVHLDPQRGPLGPVLVVAFAYIVGEVPRFTAEGRRIGDVTEYRPRRTGRTGTRRVA